MQRKRSWDFVFSLCSSFLQNGRFLSRLPFLLYKWQADCDLAHVDSDWQWFAIEWRRLARDCPTPIDGEFATASDKLRARRKEGSQSVERFSSADRGNAELRENLQATADFWERWLVRVDRSRRQATAQPRG